MARCVTFSLFWPKAACRTTDPLLAVLPLLAARVGPVSGSWQPGKKHVAAIQLHKSNHPYIIVISVPRSLIVPLGMEVKTYPPTTRLWPRNTTSVLTRMKPQCVSYGAVLLQIALHDVQRRHYVTLAVP